MTAALGTNLHASLNWLNQTAVFVQYLHTIKINCFYENSSNKTIPSAGLLST